MRLVILAFAFSLLSFGCDHNSTDGNTNDLAAGNGNGDGGFMAACIADLQSITLTPADQHVSLDGHTATPIGFIATGTFRDGHTATLDPATLDWRASRTDATPPGIIAAGTLTPNPSAGGTVTITAADGCSHSGSTSVVFFLDTAIGTPSDPNAWSGTPGLSGALPDIIYPSDQTRFPRNIYRTLFQWQAQTYNQFRLTFTGPNAKITVYTDGAHALCAGKGAGCWEADEQSWSFIAGSNAGGTVTWTVDALDAGGVIHRCAKPITIGFSKQDVTGAIFYWSTTSAGIRRANIAAATPEDYITGVPGTTYTNPDDKVKCVACHVVSRDGKYLAAPVAASSGQSLWILEVTKSAPPNPLVKQVAGTGGHGFATISPDDSTVVAAWGGKLWTVDRATGVKIADLSLGTTIKAGTHPDWSPDNTQLVFATGSGDAPGSASLAVLPFVNGSFGAPKVIVPYDNITTHSSLFPMFSPDGKWIAFSKGKGGHGDLNAQLWIAAQDGASPVALVNANCKVNNADKCLTENSQPTWAPPGDYYWVAFNSQRAYGVVSPGGMQQIWVAAIDPAKLGSGQDPSFPAFRLQFQGLNENNHRAYWTLDVRDPGPSGPPPDMAGGMCVAANQSCTQGVDTCCDLGYYCDDPSGGTNFKCITSVIP